MIKKFLIKILFVLICFGLLFSAYTLLGTKALEYRNGPGTSAITTSQFENVRSHKSDCYVLGNSRSFRGINPDKFSFSTFNFSGNGESYDLMYYKLKYILDNNDKFKYLILGVDYFQFSFNSIDNNWNFGDYFGEEFSKVYPPQNSYISKMNFLLDPLQGLNNTLGVLNSIRLYVLKKPVRANILRSNGQYMQEQRLSSDNFIERESKRTDSQVKYFEMILELCKKNDINVFMTLLPAQKEEIELYTDKNIRKSFDDFIRKYESNNVIYLDLFELNIFEDKDWLDVNHLTPSGADRFSEYMNNKIKDAAK